MILEFQYFLLSFPKLYIQKSSKRKWDCLGFRDLLIMKVKYSEMSSLQREKEDRSVGIVNAFCVLRPRRYGEMRLKITQEEITTHLS